MKSLFRYILVVGAFLIVAIAASNDKVSIAASPPMDMGKNEDPMESIYRAVRPLGGAPILQEWTTENFQSRLEDAFRRADPCMVMNLVSESAPVPPATKWAAGMSVFFRWVEDSSPVLRELYATSQSPIYGGTIANSKTKEVLFFQALQNSNQWKIDREEEQSRVSFKEVDEAINQMKVLAQEDPENGVYSFFLGQALRLLGAKKEEVESAYSQSSKAQRFDPFYQGLNDELLKLSYSNMATFVWIYSFLHRSPEPDFSYAVRNLRNWASDSEPGKWIASKLAKKLTELGAKYKLESPGYLISQQEYLLGYGLKYAIDSRVSEDREELVKRMKEAKDFISEIPAAVGAAETELFMGRIQPEQNELCNWSSWQSLYESYKAKLK
jgi:hypothetical protein